MNGNNIDKLSSKVYIRISIIELQINCIIINDYDIMINSIINRIAISVMNSYRIISINRVKLVFFYYKLNKN